jgi:hypothetical protein
MNREFLEGSTWSCFETGYSDYAFEKLGNKPGSHIHRVRAILLPRRIDRKRIYGLLLIKIYGQGDIWNTMFCYIIDLDLKPGILANH